MKQRNDWHKADIKAALEKAGWSLNRLAAENGIHGSTLGKVFSLRSYPRAEKIIAGAIGVTPAEIWPSRYDDRLRETEPGRKAA